MRQHRWAMTFTTAVMAFLVSAALAQQPPAGAVAPGQAPAPPPKVNFNEDDRQATRAWFEAHQKDLPAGLQPSDRLTPGLERKVQGGLVLDPVLVKQVKPVPPTLLHLLAPPPGIYRYGIVGWHLVLIDDSYRVGDVIHIGHR